MTKAPPRKNHEARELDQALESYASMATHVPQRDRAPYKAWLGYGAASAALVIGSAAEAAVMFSTDARIGTTLTRMSNTTTSIGLDIDGDGDDDFTLGISSYNAAFAVSFGTGSASSSGTAYGAAFIAGGGNLVAGTGSLATNSNYVNFAGDSRSRSFFGSSYFYFYRSPSTSNSSTSGTGTVSQIGAIGVNFLAGTGGGGKTSHFGWIRIALTVADGPLGVGFKFPDTLTILQAGWEDVKGEPAHVSENTATASAPGTAPLMGLGLLALGASGVRRFRRERKAKA